MFGVCSKLATDFVHTAKSLGKIIIAENFLPPENRTIQHCNVGGIAGGEKYVHHGILFKFALDKHKIYSGDHFAMKAAGHELKAVMRYVCTLHDYDVVQLSLECTNHAVCCDGVACCNSTTSKSMCL